MEAASDKTKSKLEGTVSVPREDVVELIGMGITQAFSTRMKLEYAQQVWDCDHQNDRYVMPEIGQFTKERGLWGGMACLVDQEILSDAFKEQVMLKKALSVSFPSMTMRPAPYPFQRFKDVLGSGSPEAGFVAMSSMIVLRIPSAVNRITETYLKLKALLTAIHSESMLFAEKNTLLEPDIVLKLYAVVPGTPYIIYIQIGHPFAFFHLDLDSVRHQTAPYKQAECVDLRATNLFADVRAALLAGVKYNLTMDEFVRLIDGKWVATHFYSELVDAITATPNL